MALVWGHYTVKSSDSHPDTSWSLTYGCLGHYQSNISLVGAANTLKQTRSSSHRPLCMLFNLLCFCSLPMMSSGRLKWSMASLNPYWSSGGEWTAYRLASASVDHSVARTQRRGHSLASGLAGENIFVSLQPVSHKKMCSVACEVLRRTKCRPNEMWASSH